MLFPISSSCTISMYSQSSVPGSGTCRRRVSSLGEIGPRVHCSCFCSTNEVLSHASHIPLNSLMARNRALHRIALRGVSRINLSRRLIRWMDEICMPRTALRMHYVKLVHIYHSCNFIALSDAMYTLLTGLVWVDEGDHSSSYCSHLHEACSMLNGIIRCYFP